ncbi:MAG TPA: ABC transporter permease [Thermoleophilia bacterium]|nr:ABC transporter permease [Thermoleophilia bacterium]
MPPLLKIILRRLALGLLTLLLVSVLVFVATQALPGDTARSILGRSATPERLKEVRKQLGLDRPATAQYFEWLSGVVKGDTGDSLVAKEPVRTLLGGRVMNSAALVLVAALVSIPLSILIGSLSGLLRDRWFDSSVSLSSLALAALPEFVIGILLIMLLATQVFHVLPAVSRVDPNESIWSQMDMLVLPAITLVLAVAPYIIRILRASMIEVLESDYVQMARLKGMSENIVLRRHALPNAVIPAIQVIALNLAYLAGGVVVVEYLFNYPGIGWALVDAVANRDVPVIQFIVLLIAFLYVGFNLIADIITILVSPRLRTGLQ